MADTAGKRFQYGLRELITASLLCGIGLFLLSPLILDSFGHSIPVGRYAPKTHIFCSLTIIATTLGAAFLGVWFSSRRRGWDCLATLLASVLSSWFLLWLFLGPKMFGMFRGNVIAPAASCKAYAEAQEIYHRSDHNGDGVLEYAQSMFGKESLLEHNPGAGDLCLIDRPFAYAEGLPGKVTPKCGYVFKVLKAQGPSAEGGAKSFLARGPDGKVRMTEGFALLASPDEYGITGCHSFMINHGGKYYAADLGPDTPRIFEETTKFDPDPNKGWFVGW